VGERRERRARERKRKRKRKKKNLILFLFQVNAAVVEIVPRVEPLAEVRSQEALEFVTRELIGQRRKVLSNSVR
jgi:hypothetical protein